MLKELAERGVTQEQIALYCRCCQGTVSNIARGVTKDPRSSVGMAMGRLAMLHGVSSEPKEPA